MNNIITILRKIENEAKKYTFQEKIFASYNKTTYIYVKKILK